MDQAKAIINLHEGIIQLEGPVEFVQRYLEMYAPAVKGAPTPGPQTQAPGKKAKAGGRSRGGRGSCARAVRAEIKAGFFDEPRTTKAVRERLAEKGIVCSSGALRATLKETVDKGRLQTSGRGRGIAYGRNLEMAGSTPPAEPPAA